MTLRRPSALETTPGREPKGGRFVVHCDQGECQYFETAGPPCPLRLDLFPTLTAQAKAASRAVTGEEEHARDAA